MPYKIAIASGKGGTGKTTVSVNLFQCIYKHITTHIQLIDCDVEEPNDTIFFPEATLHHAHTIMQKIPVIDTDKCTFCRKCAEYCEFNAIVVIPPVQFAEVNESLCHSCGACLVACRDKAIYEKAKSIGKVNFYNYDAGVGIIEGRLDIGSAMQTMLIKELKKRVARDNQIIIYDAPPGTSCPVVETISDADFIILVSEPTLFGLYDLQLMVDLLTEIKKPFGVVINKAGLGDQKIYKYLQKNNMEILGEIPFSEPYASNYAQGNLFIDTPKEITSQYNKIMKRLEKNILEYEGNNHFKW